MKQNIRENFEDELNKFKGQGIQDVSDDPHFDENYIPLKGKKGYYKLMRMGNDGRFYWPKAKDDGGVELGEWLIAQDYSENGKLQLYTADKESGEYKSSGTAQRRPRFHVATVPYAPQLHVTGNDGKKNKLNPSCVWCEVEIADDAGDFYERLAHNNAISGVNGRGGYNQKADIRDRIPYGGSYPYFASVAKNPDYMSEKDAKLQNHWVITGAMKLLKPLKDEEVAEILREKGFHDEDIPQRRIYTRTDKVSQIPNYNEFMQRHRPNEAKKSKKTIKEEMETYNEFILEWKKWVLKENNALQEGDYDKAAEYNMLANEAYKNYKKDTELSYEMESKTFGELKTILENNLTKLFKDKSSLLKEYTKLIKEDKNLNAEYAFYNVLSNFKEGNNAKEYISEALSLVSPKIDYKTINESNKKVQKLFCKYRNSLNNEIDENISNACKSCNYLLTRKKKINNLNEMNNHLNIVTDYTSKNAKPQLKENVNMTKLIEDFEKKLGETLNEEEQSFVQEIMATKKGSDNNKQKKLFEKIKGDCINQINKMISEGTTEEKEQLLTIKEQVLNKQFCTETLVSDIAKLLEFRDVLMS